MTDKFVVSTNEIGEIIVTDTETGNVYHYGSMSNFLGLIRLMNDEHERQNNEIKLLRKKIIELMDDLEKIPPSIREMWLESVRNDFKLLTELIIMLIKKATLSKILIVVF